jgi:hypothetical protein
MPNLAPGDKAVIKPNISRDPQWLAKWVDFPVEIISFHPRHGTFGEDQYYLNPLTPRPDLKNSRDEYYRFYWDASDIVSVEDPSSHAVDFRGNRIKVGDTIVYPGRSGSSMWMQEAKVTEIVMVTERRAVWDKKPDGSNDWSTRRVEDVDVPALRVEHPTQKWVYDPLTEKGEYVTSTWRGMVKNLNRVTVVN